MEIRPNITVLKVNMLSPLYGPSSIYPVLIRDEDGLTLVDTGMLGQFASLKEALDESGVRLTDIKRILITHQDIDHIGNVVLLTKEIPNVKLLVHEIELPYLNGSQPFIKMSPDRVRQMPVPFQEMVQGLLQDLPHLDPIQVLRDGDILPIGGGAEVIHTPGHTPGHICLYLRNSELLLAADELRVAEGALVGPLESATPDMPLALQSMHKLKGLPIRTVVCYHGGVYEGSPQALIDSLSDSGS